MKNTNFVNAIMRDIQYYMNVMGEVEGTVSVLVEREIQNSRLGTEYVFNAINTNNEMILYPLTNSFLELVQLRDKLETIYNEQKHVDMTLRRD